MSGIPLNDARRFRRAQWRMLLATMFCYLFYYTGRQTFGFAIPGMSDELGISKKQLGWASAVLFWCYAVGQAVNGNLGDKFGGRKLVSLGALISCVLNWVVSFGQSLMGLLIPWGVNGLAQSMGWAPGSGIISNWWDHRERGKAYGLYVFAAGMSSVLAFTTSLIVLKVLHLDWRWIFRLPVLLLLLGGITFYLVVRNKPEDLGFTGGPEEGDEDDGGGDGEETTAPASVGTTESSIDRYLAVLKNGRFLIASLAIGFQNFARYGLIIWVPVYFLGKDWKKADDTAWISIALAVGMAIGAVTNGWLSDKVFKSQRGPLISGFMFLAALCTGAMYFISKDNTVPAIVFLFLSGFFVYGPQSGFWALCPDIFGPKRAATATGVMNFVAYGFAGLEGIVIGSAIDRNGGDSIVVFPIVAASCVICGVIGLFIRK